MPIKDDGPQRLQTISKIFQIYHFLQNNQTYKNKIGDFKLRVLEDDINTTVLAIRCLKNILTYQKIVSCGDVCRIEGFSLEEVPRQYRNLQMNEFSKLLSLRFIRQIYFEASYPFMMVANIELEDIFRKIAMFKTNSLDEQRGTTLFTDSHETVFAMIQNKSQSKLSQQELEHIGYSLHKFILEILQMNSSLYKLLPFHIQYCRRDFQGLSPYFYNNFFKIYGVLIKEKVKLSSKFFYFKKEDKANYIRLYSTVEGALSVKRFYCWLFEQLWTLSGQLSLQAKGSDWVLNLFRSRLPILADYSIQICKKISSETNDRYFWGYLDIFLKQAAENQKKKIQSEQIADNSPFQLQFACFLVLFLVKCSNPQLLLFLQSRVQNLYIQYLRSYCLSIKLKNEEKCDLGQIKNDKNIIKKPQENIYVEILGVLINYYIILLKICKSLESQLRNQYHKNLRKYIEIIFSNIPDNEDILSRLCPFEQIKQISSICQNIKINKAKEAFIHVYLMPCITYKLDSALFERFLSEIQIIKSESYWMKFKNILQNKSIYEEDIIIESKEALLDEIQSVNSDNRIKFSTPSKYSGYKMNCSSNSQLTFRSQALFTSEKDKSDKSSASERKTPHKYSFTKELKINMATSRKDLLKSISKVHNLSIQRATQSLSKSKNSELLRISGQLKSTIQRGIYRQEYIQSEPLNTQYEQSEKLSTFKEVYSNLQEIVPIEKRNVYISSNSNSIIKSRVRKNQKIGKAEPINNSFSFNMYMENKKKSQNVEKNLKKRKIPTLSNQESFDTYKNEEEISHSKISKLSLHRNNYISNSSKQIMNPLQQLYFYFLPKTKRELLKTKVLILKNKHLQIGMITKNQQTDLQSKSPNKIKISIYLTSMISMKNVSANIRCPSWLLCTEKSNNQFQAIEKERQNIPSFTVELRNIKQKIYKKNYGDFPVLNIAYHDDDNKKYTISQSLPFLIIKFCIQQASDESQIRNLLSSKQLQKTTKIHEKLLQKLEDIKHYFKMSESIRNQQEFSNFFKGQQVKNQLIFVKLEYLPNRQPLYLIFFEIGEAESTNEYEINSSRFLSMDILAVDETKWDFGELHIIKTCFRSIFSI